MPDPKIVNEMFKSVAPSYNFMNTAMTLGLDGLQRDVLAKAVAKTKTENIVDIACGSGVLSFAIARAFEKEGLTCHITGTDFCEPLLKIAQRDLPLKKFSKVSIDFKIGDALALPLPDGQFDAATIGFGIRNFESRPKAYAEILRVLKPGGLLFILETSQPRGFIRPFHFMWASLVPLFAKLVGTNSKAYKHLIDSSRAFPTADVLAKELEANGFKNVTYKRLLGGTLAMHQGRKE